VIVFLWQAFGLQPHRQTSTRETLVRRITQQAIRRGTFSSVKDLVEKIDHYVKNSNRHAQPFVWTATADSIFAQVERPCARIYGTAQ
jgi:hypothetical protein